MQEIAPFIGKIQNKILSSGQGNLSSTQQARIQPWALGLKPSTTPPHTSWAHRYHFGWLENVPTGRWYPSRTHPIHLIYAGSGTISYVKLKNKCLQREGTPLTHPPQTSCNMLQMPLFHKQNLKFSPSHVTWNMLDIGPYRPSHPHPHLPLEKSVCKILIFIWFHLRLLYARFGHFANCIFLLWK